MVDLLTSRSAHGLATAAPANGRAMASPRLKSFLAGQIKMLRAALDLVRPIHQTPSRYAAMEFELPCYEARNVALEDMELNFLIRIILERQRAGRPVSKFVEVGAHRAYRIRHLKRLFPELECVAADIIQNYKTIGERDSVRFIGHDDCAAEMSPGTLVFGTQIFACLNAEELTDFFSLCAGAGAAIALFEPKPICAVDATTRRGTYTFFHPYRRYLGESGFNVVPHDGAQKTYAHMAWFMAPIPEQWQAIYAEIVA